MSGRSVQLLRLAGRDVDGMLGYIGGPVGNPLVVVSDPEQIGAEPGKLGISAHHTEDLLNNGVLCLVHLWLRGDGLASAFRPGPRFETAKLLSGVVYSDDRGVHLVRRAQFQDHPGISALLQTGPYLVEGGQTVRGLSATDPRRRTFIATDGRGHWVLGAALSPLTLAELSECLASPGALTPWRTDRAINLDGGSSTGFFFDRGAGKAPVTLHPLKRVRNLLGITPR